MFFFIMCLTHFCIIVMQRSIVKFATCIYPYSIWFTSRSVKKFFEKHYQLSYLFMLFKRTTQAHLLKASKTPQSEEMERQSGNTGRLNTNLYVMLKFTKQPRALGITSKKTWLLLKGINCFQVIFVLSWMKQALIWFSL